MTTRIKYIDIAKGLAILCVVCGHILVYDIYGFTYVWDRSPLIQFICSFHMPLFIFLSGLVASPPSSIQAIPKDLYKRFRNLIIPFLVIGSIYSLSFHGNLSFITNEMKYGYWYFLILFYCYIINYFSINDISSNKEKIIFFFQMCLLLMLWKIITHLANSFPEAIQHSLSINQFRLYFPYFFIASIIKRLHLHNILFNNSHILFTAIIIIVSKSYLQFPYSNLITTFAIIVIIINICKKIEPLNISNKLQFIGINTLYIYCFHYFALQFMKMDFIGNRLTNSSLFLDLFLSIIPMMVAIAFSFFAKKILLTEKLVQVIFNKSK